MMSTSFSIIIPAYREEGNIEAAIDNVVAVAKSMTTDYEIIVVDDGSPDKTGEFAQFKAEVNAHIRVVSNATNQGFGFSFARGVKMATKDFVTVFPGDNDMAAQSLKDLMEAHGSADLVISYVRKNNKRSMFRHVVSWCFVLLMNLLFGLRLKYYNGAFICRRQLLQGIPIKSTGLAALAECIIRLLKQGVTWRAIYFEHAGRRHEKSKAFSLKSINAIVATILMLLKDMYWPQGKKSC